VVPGTGQTGNLGLSIAQHVVMRKAILKATDDALRRVSEPRFFRTERGFHGRFYCALQQALDERQLLRGLRILEMEYQKSARHGMTQRPDIILHEPAEDSASSVAKNNVAVWALKRKASPTEALDDFNKLDQMFRTLNYPLGIFVNIDSGQHHGDSYSGEYPKRFYAVAVRLDKGHVEVNWSRSPRGGSDA